LLETIDAPKDSNLYKAVLYSASLIDSGYSIDLNQGMDARLVTDKIAVILANLKWIKYIRFSCDSIPQIEAISSMAEDYLYTSAVCWMNLRMV